MSRTRTPPTKSKSGISGTDKPAHSGNPRVRSVSISRASAGAIRLIGVQTEHTVLLAVSTANCLWSGLSRPVALYYAAAQRAAQLSRARIGE